MLLHNHPATSYISWFGLVIIDETDTPYVITDGKSCMKYIYWEMDNPYVLRESNEWIMESSTRRMIYINDNGTGTEVPHDTIAINYNDTGNGSSSKLVGEALGKFDELNGKYITIKEDVDGIKEVLGSSETGGDGNNSLIERLNILEKTAEGTTERISTVEKSFTNDKELEQLRNNLNISIIDVGEALSYYRESFSNASKDLEVSTDESLDISQKQTELLDAYTVLAQYHEALITRLTNSEEDNTTVINNLNNSLNSLRTSINNLNSIVNTAISDNTIVPSELTTVLNLLATVALRNNEYKNLVSDSILLGIGGRLTESILNIRKTSSEFSQTISEVVEEIDGETGLKVAVAKNATAIEQNSREISLSCVKFDETTSKLTVGDGVIKLDASQVLMTGTLTWDSLDDEAKQNLKGADGSAEYVMLTGDQIFKYDRNNNPNVQYITLSAQISNIENPIYDWYYKNVSISTDWIHIEDNTNLSTLTLYHNDAMWGDNENSITIRVVCNGLSDDMTIVKLYDGEKGIDSKTVKINGEQLFRYKTVNSTPEPTSIVLNGSRNNIVSTASRWYYKNSENGDWTEITAFRGFDSLTISHDSSYFGSSNILMIKYEVEMYDDVMTLAKIYDGSDGYFVLLTNENHSVPCDENGNYDSASLENAHTYIRVYKGLEEVNSFSVTRVDSGCVSSYNSSTKRLDITRLTENTATVTMTITVENTSFQKVMTITKSIKGEKGEDGTGVNVIGQLDDVSQLPSTGSPGDAYIINGLLYVWSDITNGWSDGVPFRGEQGLPGKPGEDGRTTYLHIKYSNDGQTFTNNNGEEPGDWLGQYTDYFEDDSTTFSDYTWKKIKGEDGDNGIVANLTNDTHIIPVNADGTFGEDSFEGCSTKISLSYIGVEITNGVTYGYTASDGVEGDFNSSTGTYTVTGWSGTGTSAYVDLKAIYNGVTYTKRFDITKSKSPYDAYTIILTNESHTFAGDVTNALNGSTTCDIFAYKGTQLVNLFVGTITNIPTGMNVSISNNNTSNVTLNISVNTSMTSGYGTLDIPIAIGQLNFTKTFSYAVSFRGAQGLQGIPGIPGEDGKDGNSVKVLGRYDTLDQLNQAHPSGNENGDGYIVDKDLWVWTDTEFINVGQFQGEDGTNAYVHIKYSNDGKTFTDNDGEEIGSWIGMYTDTIEADSTNFSDYRWAKYQGSDAKILTLTADRQVVGFNSDNTVKDSTAIILTANQQNFNDTLTWSTSPNVTLGGSGNNRTLAVSNFVNNTQIVVTVTGGGLTDSVSIIKVSDGQRGADGTSVKILDSYDTLDQLNQAHPSGNENGDGYMVGKDLYIWNGTTFINAGQIRGNDGKDGVDGTNGTNAYVHIKYSNDGGKTFTSNSGETPGDYMGVYTDSIQADSTNPSDYNWSLTKGNDGWDAYTVVLSNESHTFAGGTSGAIAGSTTCNVIAYKGGTQVAPTIGSITGVPTGMSTSISNNNSSNAYFTVSVTTAMTTRNGVLTVPITIDGITFTKRFTYSLSLSGTDGSDGADARLLTLSANRQTIAYNNNNTVKDNTAITLTANQQNFNDTITWSTSPSVTLNGSGTSRTLAVSNFNNNTTIRVTITAGGLSDTVTLVKVLDGNNGEPAYNVVLSNESHTFAGGETNAIAGSTTCRVLAYRGSTQVACSIGTISNIPTGMSINISNNNTVNATLNISVTTSMSSKNGTVNIPITIDGHTFTKTFTYALALMGSTGLDAKLLSLSASKQAIAFNSNNTPKDTSAVTLTALQQNFSDSITWSTSPSVTLSGSGNSRILSVSNFTNNNVIKVTITAGSLSDTITLVKVIDGTDGTDGSDGKDGIDGYVVNISNDNHTFVANENGAIVSQQATTTVVTAFRGTTSVAPTIGTLPTVNGLTLSRNGSTITIIAPVGSNMATHGTFNIPVTIDGISFNKAFSYSKVNCGENGEDGYTVILTNEAHIFPCASNGNIATAISTTTVVRAFKGNTEITPTIGTLPSVTGLTLSKSGTTITIRANTGTSLASSGSFDIPVTVDGKTFTKTFSWAKSFAGEDGKFEDEIPAWITEWDNGKTTINGSTVLSPKIFAGSVSNGKPTGVAIGKNVFGTSGDYANISGIVGYKNGTKTYEFNTNGSVLIGNNNKHIKWDGTNFEIIADKITLGATNISDNINDVKTEYYISTSSKTLTGGSWSTNPPTIKVGKYIWQRTKTVTVSGTISYSTPVCVNNDGYTIMLSNETLLLKCDSEGRVI